MNDLMRSVADIPGDADDDLSEISPELVLVDPELARRVREEAAAAAAAAASRDRPLRLVQAAARASDAEPAEQRITPRPDATPRSRDTDLGARDGAVENDELVVPRAVVPTEPPAPSLSEPVEPDVEEPSASRAVVYTPTVAAERGPASEAVREILPPAPAVPEPAEPEAVREILPPAAAVPEPAEPEAGELDALQTTVVTPAEPPQAEPTPTVPATEPESEALPVAATRVVDAETARVVVPSHPAFPVTAPEADEVPPEPQPGPRLTPAMPHAIVRPGGPTPAPQAPRAPRRGRGTIAFLASVAVASVTVLGILNLTGGNSSSGAGAIPASGESGTSSSAGAPATATKKDSAKAKATAKARAQAAARAKAAAAAKARAEAAARAKAAARARAAAQAKAAKAKAAKAKGAKGAKPKPAPATSGTQPAATPGAAPSGVEPRRFAWAPVEGAIAYHVELFKGSDRVLAQETKAPILELGPTWKYDGRLVRLTPGAYRWYVWPVTKSGRSTQAVVQAKLTIP
jgi:hypothetical protein